MFCQILAISFHYAYISTSQNKQKQKKSLPRKGRELWDNSECSQVYVGVF